jgi:hypothetical protein
MNTRTQAAPSLTLRDLAAAMPIVILARAVVSALGDRVPGGVERRSTPPQLA